MAKIVNYTGILDIGTINKEIGEIIEDDEIYKISSQEGEHTMTAKGSQLTKAIQIGSKFLNNKGYITGPIRDTHIPHALIKTKLDLKIRPEGVNITKI